MLTGLIKKYSRLKHGRILSIIHEVYIRSKNDEVPALAAQLTYYFILSFFPFLIFIITLISYTPIANEIALSSISGILPPVACDLVLDVINEASLTPRKTFLSFGMLTALWVSSNGMNAVIRGLNKAYDRKETRPYWKVKGLSIMSIIALALAIILSLGLLVFGETMGEQLFKFTVFKTAWTVIRICASFLFIIMVFSFLYMLVPNRRMTLKEVLPGSVFTTLGWILVSSLFSFYINNFADFSRMYGSIGGVIALLVWLYWISIIIILGGELNASLAINRSA
ncbi:MAG TPA: YihY/virulence factor BrkB family protein [Acetivibrio sp.]|jgi:membrane protein|nr:YihY/virulence factor BrkB family protein [Acetivibrio sp.]HPT90631.1 YihY/virulence factor BrkB family protein [Acetivibrio sp.]HQA56995.1 YihY/virulence factor BrkB family protein [Acetivibrio sp.]